jgi:hypothetical protein
MVNDDFCPHSGHFSSLAVEGGATHAGALCPSVMP